MRCATCKMDKFYRGSDIRHINGDRHIDMAVFIDMADIQPPIKFIHFARGAPHGSRSQTIRMMMVVKVILQIFQTLSQVLQ